MVHRTVSVTRYNNPYEGKGYPFKCHCIGVWTTRLRRTSIVPCGGVNLGTRRVPWRACGTGGTTAGAARRVDLYGYEAYDRLRDGESELVRERAVEIHREATERLTGWRREAVSDLLLDRSGQVRRDPSVHAVIRARHLVDEANQDNHAKRRYLQRQLRYLLGLGVVSLTVFMIGVVEANPLAMGDVTLPAFALYIPLIGALGASLFGVRSASKTATSANVPQNFTPLGVVLARLFIGSLSAIALYLGLTAGVINVVDGGTLSPALLLLVAFAAGYSERLAPQAVERVSGITGSTTSK